MSQVSSEETGEGAQETSAPRISRESSGSSEAENLIQLQQKLSSVVDESEKQPAKKTKAVHFTDAPQQIAVGDQPDCAPVTSDEEESIADFNQTSTLMNSTLTRSNWSSKFPTQYIDLDSKSDQKSNDEPSSNYVTLDDTQSKSDRYDSAETKKLGEKTLNEQTFDSTYADLNNETTIMQLNRTKQTDISDYQDENVYGKAERTSEYIGADDRPNELSTNYVVMESSLLKPISLPRSEITLVLFNIGCEDTKAQDFLDLIKEVNNVEVLGQFFVISHIQSHSENESSHAASFYSDNQNIFSLAFYDASKFEEASLKSMRANLERMRLPKDSILLCGLTNANEVLEENFHLSLFALKNHMMHKMCSLTFASVANSLEWAVQLKLDTTYSIVMVPSRKTPDSPVENRMVSNKHFDTVSVDGKSSDDYTFTICLIGASKSGKSKIVQSFVSGSYQEGYQKTIGADFLQKSVRLNYKNIKLQFWDFGSGYENLVRGYVEKADCVIGVFDYTSRKSLQALSDVIDKYKSVIDEKLLMIAGSKVDLKTTDIQDTIYIQSIANKHRAVGWFPISSKTGEGVENMLVDCCIMLMQRSARKARSHSAEPPPSERQSAACSII